MVCPRSRKVLPCLLSLFVLTVSFSASLAADNGIYNFDWQEKTGSWVYGWGHLPDERIPAEQHSIKKVILDMVDTRVCGIGKTNIDAIKVFSVNFNGDTMPDYVVDASAYLKQGYNRETCPVQYCADVSHDNTEACLLQLFSNASLSQLMPGPEEKADVDCPATPGENTRCLDACPATPTQCPGLFKYEMNNVFSRYAFDWKFVSVPTYIGTIKNVRNIYSSPMYRTDVGTTPVLIIDTEKGECAVEELNQWNNRCVKFYQYMNAQFVDLFLPSPDERR